MTIYFVLLCYAQQLTFLSFRSLLFLFVFWFALQGGCLILCIALLSFPFRILFFLSLLTGNICLIPFSFLFDHRQTFS